MNIDEKKYEIDINHLIKEMNLPKTTKFIGYGIHIPQRDEFLAKAEETNIGSVNIYTKTPEMAKTWETAKEAIQQVKEIQNKYNDACVVALIDVENQIAVLTPHE